MATCVPLSRRIKTRKKEKKKYFFSSSISLALSSSRDTNFSSKARASRQRERKWLLQARTKLIVSAAPPQNATNSCQLLTAKHGAVIYRLAICRNGAHFISTSPAEPIWAPRRPGCARTCGRPLRRAASRLPRQEEAFGDGMRRRRLQGVWWQGGTTRRLWLRRYYIGGIEG